jgi:hypothetical protein
MASDNEAVLLHYCLLIMLQVCLRSTTELPVQPAAEGMVLAAAAGCTHSLLTTTASADC